MRAVLLSGADGDHRQSGRGERPELLARHLMQQQWSSVRHSWHSPPSLEFGRDQILRSEASTEARALAFVVTTTPEQLKARLHGVIAFAPTPFDAHEQLDVPSLMSHLDRLCRANVQTIVVCGGVGEFFALDEPEYVAVVRAAAQVIAGRATLLAGVGHFTRLACRLAEHAATAGVDGLMVNPTYFLQPADDGWGAHYRALAQAAGLGLMVFSTAGASYSPDALERLTEIPEVVAFKDELADFKLLGELIDRLDDRLVWINGMAELLLAPYVALGASAVTSGLVNIAPALSLSIWDAAAEGRWADLQSLLRGGVRRLARLRERRPGYQIMVIKEALNLLGRPGGGTGRRPLMPMMTDDRHELRELLASMALLEPTVVHG
jgi:5-dehydro-4-deoxyglucarate dehydratase